MPGGNPVTAVPGLRPRLPSRTVGPVLVTVEPASTAKFAAVPRSGACAWLCEPSTMTRPIAAQDAAKRRRKTAPCADVPTVLWLDGDATAACADVSAITALWPRPRWGSCMVL